MSNFDSWMSLDLDIGPAGMPDSQHQDGVERARLLARILASLEHWKGRKGLNPADKRHLDATLAELAGETTEFLRSVDMLLN